MSFQNIFGTSFADWKPEEPVEEAEVEMNPEQPEMVDGQVFQGPPIVLVTGVSLEQWKGVVGDRLNRNKVYRKRRGGRVTLESQQIKEEAKEQAIEELENALGIHRVRPGVDGAGSIDAVREAVLKDPENSVVVVERDLNEEEPEEAEAIERSVERLKETGAHVVATLEDAAFIACTRI